MKRFLVFITIFCIPMFAKAGGFGIAGGLGSGSISNTGLSANSGEITTGFAWNLDLTYDFEGNNNYVKLGVVNQLAELKAYSSTGTVTADANIWLYEVVLNYYLFNIAETVNVYGALSGGSAKLEIPNIGSTDSKWFVGLGANFRYKATDNIYISGMVEYKKVFNDFALLMPTLNLEFKF